eukprot:gene30345-35348_t
MILKDKIVVAVGVHLRIYDAVDNDGFSDAKMSRHMLACIASLMAILLMELPTSHATYPPHLADCSKL